MAERRLQRSQRGAPRNIGPAASAVTLTLITPQWCTHRPGVKRVKANACPFRAANCLCTNVCPSYNCRNQGYTRVPTAPSLTINVIETIKESQEFDPTLFQAINLVIFHQYAPAFSPSILLRGDEWPALLTCADTTHTSPALTDISVPNPATPAAGGSGKIISNFAQPIYVQTASPSPPSN